MSEFMADLVFWLNTASPGLLLGIVELSLRALLLLAGAWAVALLLRHYPAAQRHALWSVAIAMAVLLPLLTTVVPALRLPLPGLSVFLPDQSVETSIQVEAATRIRILPIGPIHTGPAVPPLSWQSIALLLWVAGTGIVVLWLLAGRLRAWLLVRRAHPLPRGRISKLAEDIADEYNLTAPRVLLSAETEVPMVVGLVRPALLVPERAKQWSDFQLRTMLLHELAHVQRRDMLAHAPAFAALALHWLNPLAWLATRKQVYERELAADEAVLSCGIRPSDYAEQLLAAAGQVNGLRFAPGTIAGMARGADFKRRVRHILGSAPLQKPAKRRNVAMTALAIVLISLPIAAWQPWTAEVTEINPAETVAVPVTEPFTETATPEADISKSEKQPSAQEKPEPRQMESESADLSVETRPEPKQENPRREGSVDSSESTPSTDSKEPSAVVQDEPLEVNGSVMPPEVRFEGAQPFPQKAKTLRRSGHVKVRLIIRADGSWEFVDFLEEEPEGFGFGDTLLEYLKQSEWTPAMRDGEPVDVYFDLSVNFALSPRSAPSGSLPRKGDKRDDAEAGNAYEDAVEAFRKQEQLRQYQPDRYRDQDGIYYAGPGGLPEPELIKRVEPDYPEVARKLRINGYVLLEAVIDEQGFVESVKLLQTPPKRFGFGEAAIKAVKQWEFEPTTVNGEPVKVRIRFSVEFNMVADKPSNSVPSLPPGMEDEEAFQPPEVTFKGRLPYPRRAKILRYSGQAKVRLLIHADGSWEFLELLGVTPDKFGFDEAALRFLKHSEWRPATYKGTPIDYVYDLTVNFPIAKTGYDYLYRWPRAMR